MSALLPRCPLRPCVPLRGLFVVTRRLANPPQVHMFALRAVAHLASMVLCDADALGYDPRFTAPLQHSPENRHRAATLLVPMELRGSLADVTTEGSEAAAAAVDEASPFVEPHINSVLRLVGAWLFDAALNPHRPYAPGRAVALLALGKVFVTPRRHGGRQGSCKPSPAHATRFALALRLALTTEKQQKQHAASLRKRMRQRDGGDEDGKLFVCPGTPETVAAVLRGAGAVLGADLAPGLRAILKSLNDAATVSDPLPPLASHIASPLPWIRSVRWFC